ncbi:MAG: hypothetical protein LBD23_13915 [Oscillospiraceae bacterium]|jgi:hypothetical protein|nr:hypothetical protein [Oscillospiraceae bacterium]
MKRTLLVNEIFDFCFEYGIFNKTEETKNAKVSIYHQLEDVVFVERFINLLIIKTKNRNDIDFEKLKMLLLELERIRLELEYK